MNIHFFIKAFAPFDVCWAKSTRVASDPPRIHSQLKHTRWCGSPKKGHFLLLGNCVSLKSIGNRFIHASKQSINKYHFKYHLETLFPVFLFGHGISQNQGLHLNPFLHRKSHITHEHVKKTYVCSKKIASRGNGSKPMFFHYQSIYQSWFDHISLHIFGAPWCSPGPMDPMTSEVSQGQLGWRQLAGLLGTGARAPRRSGGGCGRAPG